MEITNKRIRIWYSGISEILNGYKLTGSLEELVGISESNVIQLQNRLRANIQLSSENLNEYSIGSTLPDDVIIQLPYIVKILENVLVSISEWELPLRMDATKSEIENEVKEIKSYISLRTIN
jgi:hypothetical protein